MLNNLSDLYYLFFTGRTHFPAQQLMVRVSLNPEAESCKSKQSPGDGCDEGLHKGLSLAAAAQRRAALPLLPSKSLPRARDHVQE